MNGQELFEYLKTLTKTEREGLLEFRWWSVEDVERHLRSFESILEKGFCGWAGTHRVTREDLGKIKAILSDDEAKRAILGAIDGMDWTSFEAVNDRIVDAIGDFLEEKNAET